MWVVGIGVILGLILGSLVDCLADRSIATALSKKESSFWGRSYCDRCKKTLKWYDLFPVLSYLLLSGKCRYCHKKISTESLWTEIGMGILTGILVYFSSASTIPSLAYPQNALALFDLLFKIFATTVLAILFITDLKKGIIPDRISIPSILISLVYLVLINVYKVYLLYQSLSRSLLGRYLLPPHSDYFQRHVFIDAASLPEGLLAALIVIIFFGGLIVVTRGRGMGGGDLKLGILIGLILGFPAILFSLFLSFVLGSLVGILLILLRKKHFGQTIPFGPFLSLSSYIFLVWGTQIIQGYLNFRIF